MQDWHCGLGVIANRLYVQPLCIICVHGSYQFLEIPNRRKGKLLIGSSLCSFLGLLGFRIKHLLLFIYSFRLYLLFSKWAFILNESASDSDRPTLTQSKATSWRLLIAIYFVELNHYDQ